ncbi:MAG: nucleoside-diphosphate-sugar epimerase [Alphaproteobacteria bacterium]|jgi:nucleoside-diphosphate-sugar epimerase
MTTLITGAGLVGTSFAQQALERGEDVVFFDPEPRADFIELKLGNNKVPQVRGDVRSLPDLISAIQDHKATTVVHTAGIIGGKVDDILYAALQINVQGTINVGEAVRLTGVKRLVHISTFGVYDMRRDVPKVMGEDFHRGHGRAYGNSKVAKELMLEAYQAKYGFELIGVRPANVFGNGHFWSGSGGGGKIHEMVLAGLDGRPAQIPAGQTVANEYIYAKDIGGIVNAAATAPIPKQLWFNAGTGILTPFEELVTVMKKFFPNFSYEVLPGKAGKDRDTVLDISAAKAQINWTPKYDLETAIGDYIEEVKTRGRA